MGAEMWMVRTWYRRTVRAYTSVLQSAVRRSGAAAHVGVPAVRDLAQLLNRLYSAYLGER